MKGARFREAFTVGGEFIIGSSIVPYLGYYRPIKTGVLNN